MTPSRLCLTLVLCTWASVLSAQEGKLIARPDAFKTLMNPACSHCRDEAKRRANDLMPGDPVLCWIRGYSDGGAIPHRFFLNAHRVISDTYGVFVFDAEAGYSRAFAPSLDFRFHGWRNGIMVMQHKDGTLYSCLSGLAFDGPRKGHRLQPVPTLVADWDFALKSYPQAVAFRMFDKYQAVEHPKQDHPDSLKTRGLVDKRMPGNEVIFGVTVGSEARAYRLDAIAPRGMLHDEIAGQPCVLLWREASRTLAAYRPVASPPRPAATSSQDVKEEPRRLTIELDGLPPAHRFRDKETGSHWDITGRAVAGKLQGWTLHWLDGVRVNWFAWSAEYPHTTIYEQKQQTPKAKPKDAIKEIAGSAEFLKAVPKKYATVRSVDGRKREVTLLIDGDKEPTKWTLTPDAEIKIRGWWGRLDQLDPDNGAAGRGRVWAWFKMDRSKKPLAIFMLSDELSEQDIHGGAQVKLVDKQLVLVGPKKQERPLAQPDKLPLDRGEEKCCECNILKAKDVVFVETQNGKIVKVYDTAGLEALRKSQRGWLRQVWLKEGLPGAVGFLHVYSGEVDVILDHEAMRWGRSLTPGSKVELAAKPAIKAVVKSVIAQREKTQVRLVVSTFALAELSMGQRVQLLMPAPAAEVEDSIVPPGIDRPKTKEERIEWFLANIYCTCGVAGDVCTGHFYTLASCNPNGCAAPNATRQYIGKKIDEGLTNQEIFQALLKQRGNLMLRPHLLP